MYIPLSFVAGLFGMNVAQFNSDKNIPLWHYLAVSIPITLASMVLVLEWRAISWFLERSLNRVQGWLPKGGGYNKPTTSVSLANIGYILARHGRPGIEKGNIVGVP
jgi:hypothetical protein